MKTHKKKCLYATLLHYSYSYSDIMLQVHQAGEQKKPLNSQNELYWHSPVFCLHISCPYMESIIPLQCPARHIAVVLKSWWTQQTLDVIAPLKIQGDSATWGSCSPEPDCFFWLWGGRDLQSKAVSLISNIHVSLFMELKEKTNLHCLSVKIINYCNVGV